MDTFTVEIDYPGFKQVEPEKQKGKLIIELDTLIDLVESRQQWSFSELRANIMKQTGKVSRTAERRIDDLLNMGKIVKTIDGTYEVISD